MLTAGCAAPSTVNVSALEAVLPVLSTVMVPVPAVDRSVAGRSASIWAPNVPILYWVVRLLLFHCTTAPGRMLAPVITTCVAPDPAGAAAGNIEVSTAGAPLSTVKVAALDAGAP